MFAKRFDYILIFVIIYYINYKKFDICPIIPYISPYNLYDEVSYHQRYIVNEPQHIYNWNKFLDIGMNILPQNQL